MIEKFRTYVPVAEKITLAKRIAENVVDEHGIIDKNNFKIANCALFVGAYVQDRTFTTNDYDYIFENKIESELQKLLDSNEIKEWDTIVNNELNLVSTQRKFENTNVMASIVSLLKKVDQNIDSKNFDKMAKQINKIIDDPEKLKNFKSLQEVANKIQ